MKANVAAKGTTTLTVTHNAIAAAMTRIFFVHARVHKSPPFSPFRRGKRQVACSQNPPPPPVVAEPRGRDEGGEGPRRYRGVHLCLFLYRDDCGVMARDDGVKHFFSCGSKCRYFFVDVAFIFCFLRNEKHTKKGTFCTLFIKPLFPKAILASLQFVPRGIYNGLFMNAREKVGLGPTTHAPQRNENRNSNERHLFSCVQHT